MSMSMHGAMFFTPSGDLDLRGFEDPFKNFVQLVNSVPLPPPATVSQSPNSTNVILSPSTKLRINSTKNLAFSFAYEK
jgi:hypothetical protein